MAAMLRPSVWCALAVIALAPAGGCGGGSSSDKGGADAGAGSDGTTADGSETAIGAEGSVGADGGAGTDGGIGADVGDRVSGLPWAGILDPTRAIDWSQAGVVGGIPTRTTVCATLNPGATAAQINAAIAACPDGQVVSLTAGSYAISDDGIVMKSGVTLRGAGADKTLLTFSTTNYCSNLSAAICFSGSNDWSGAANTQPGAANAADWTGGYAQGATQITLSNVGSTGITAGQYIYLDQANDTAPGSDFFVCDQTMASCSLEGGNGGRVIGGVLRSQIQIVQVTAVNGSTCTITPGLYSPNWRSSQSPGAWWATKPIENAGLEDLSVDATNSGGQMNVAVYNAMNDWVRGVRLVRTCTCQRDLVQLNMAAHCTVADSYFYGTQGQSVNYGVEAYGASDDRIENNIFQHVVAPMVVQPSLGSVYAYNYAINDTYADSQGVHWVQDEFIQHNAGVEFQLYEGNVGPGFGGDVFHGNQLMNTLFRNYFLGTDPGRADDTTAVSLESYVRYMNIVGNVLGTPGMTTKYQVTAGPGADGTVFNLGGGNTEGNVAVAADSKVLSTLLRWGNYDTANAAARFEASEVPAAVTPYGNAVPKDQTLPASFFLAVKPAWWPSAKAWPAIGPDVAGGNITGLGGHANTIPAEDCFLGPMAGPADGSGNVLMFSATACYGP
jgi:hypothetical protein